MSPIEQIKRRFLGSPNKFKAFAVIGVLALVIVIFHGYHARNAATGQRLGELKPTVDVVTIQRQDMIKKIDLTGQTVPAAQVDITAKYAGKITQVNADLGQAVTPGQVLLVQDTSDVNIAIMENDAGVREAEADAIESDATFQASYLKAQQDYRQSVVNYQRYKALYAIGGVSKEALDNVEQQVTAAKAALDTWTRQLVGGSAAAVASKQAARDKAQHTLEALQNQRADLVIRAPRAGVIGYRQAEVGMIAQTGQKLLSIVDNSRIYVDCSVAEQDIGQITLGMPANIAVESLGRTYSGKIIYVSPAMSSTTLTFTVRIAIDNPDDSIKSGMFARTEINVLLRPQTLFVPKEAVISLNGTDRVFVVGDNNQAVERVVQVGLRNDKDVEIIGGISEGEQVAVTNLARLKNGLTIEPNPVME